MSYPHLLAEAATRFAADPLFWLIGLLTIGLIAFSKGAFGGGAASLGVPMLSLLIDPIGAAIIVAPLIVIMDMFTLRTFGPSSWSKPDLKVLIPGLLFGLACGWLLFETVDTAIVGLTIAGVSILFAMLWFWKRWQARPAKPRNVSLRLGMVAGAASGFTTFIAHAGGPPVTMYLIGRQLEKRLFVGTNTAFFTLGNLLKLGPYGALVAARPDAAAAALLLSPIILPSVLAGLRAHHRLSQDAILILTNALLLIGGARLFAASLKAVLP